MLFSSPVGGLQTFINTIRGHLEPHQFLGACPRASMSRDPGCKDRMELSWLHVAESCCSFVSVLAAPEPRDCQRGRRCVALLGAGVGRDPVSEHCRRLLRAGRLRVAQVHAAELICLASGTVLTSGARGWHASPAQPVLLSAARAGDASMERRPRWSCARDGFGPILLSSSRSCL